MKICIRRLRLGVLKGDTSWTFENREKAFHTGRTTSSTPDRALADYRKEARESGGERRAFPSRKLRSARRCQTAQHRLHGGELHGGRHALRSPPINAFHKSPAQ